MSIFCSILQILFGLQFAYDIGATFVLDVTGLQHNGEHGGYPWFDQYTGLSHNELTLEYVVQHFNPTIVVVCPAYDALQHIAVNGASACNTLYVLQGTDCCSHMHNSQSTDDATHHSINHDCWFFECTRGLFEHFQAVMAEKYEIVQSQASQVVVSNTVYHTEEYNVAIHIRTGDIQLHIGDTQFFTNMIQSTVHTHLRHMPVHIYYIGQFGSVSDNTNTMTESPTADWSFLNKLHVNTSFYNPDEQTALHHFIQADMTIITGSSFPYIAMVLSQKPIFVAAVPKAGTEAFHYVPPFSPQHVVHNVNADGHLQLYPSEDFTTAIADHLLKHGKKHLTLLHNAAKQRFCDVAAIHANLPSATM
jgi:hypothetical protein